MRYKVIEEKGHFKVLEIPTNQVIRSFKDKYDAKNFNRYLNFGGGFDGWTPNFFLKKAEINLKLN